jgi:hypothetical protein
MHYRGPKVTITKYTYAISNVFGYAYYTLVWGFFLIKYSDFGGGKKIN